MYTHTHTYLSQACTHFRIARISQRHDKTGVNHALEGGVLALPRAGGHKQPLPSPPPPRPPFTPRGLVGSPHACPAGLGRSGPPVPCSSQQGDRVAAPRLPLQTPLPLPATPAQSRGPRAAFRPPRHPSGAQTRLSPQNPSGAPPPERNRSEIPPPAPLWERKERGRGERENLCEWKRDRPQTFPRVFLEQPRGGGGY